MVKENFLLGPDESTFVLNCSSGSTVLSGGFSGSIGTGGTFRHRTTFLPYTTKILRYWTAEVETNLSSNNQGFVSFYWHKSVLFSRIRIKNGYRTFHEKMVEPT
jgi:hypothetical protein